MDAPGLPGTGQESPAPSAEVTLRLPSEPAFLRVARVTASGLASRMGFSIDEVDDLRLAVDELCRPLVVADQADGAKRGAGRIPTLVLRLRSTPAALEVEAWSEGPEGPEVSDRLAGWERPEDWGPAEGSAAEPGEGSAAAAGKGRALGRAPGAASSVGVEPEVPEVITIQPEDAAAGQSRHSPRLPGPPSPEGSPRRSADPGEAQPGLGTGPSSLDGLGRTILRVLVDDFGTLGRGQNGGSRQGLWFLKARSG